MNQSVREITTAIASGDTEAFASFYRQWFDFVFASARRCSSARPQDEQSCLDIVQETMMRVIRSMKPMNTEDSLRGWLHKTVQSCWCDHHRRQRRRSRREAAVGGSHPHPNAQNHDPALEMRLDWLRERLGHIAPDEAHLLTLRYRLGWTLQRIGRALGLKTGAVDGRIARILEMLRRQAREELND